MPSLQLADGQKVELGATWLHGIKGHPIYDLAVQYGLMDPHTSKGGSSTSLAFLLPLVLHDLLLFLCGQNDTAT